ncbi:MAG: hypothetical protein K1X89_13385 [Myxococcaceae bacterium]|nr:hypothetical protein [Myxococcaceae bacterium]
MSAIVDASRAGWPVLRLSAGDASAELAPTRGGLVTSVRLRGRELLALDEATFADGTKNVRGGIPVLFPFAGKPPAGSPFAQHGFARLLPFRVVEREASGERAQVSCVLEASEATAAYPHRFRLTQTLRLSPGLAELQHEVLALSDQVPVHFGLHPYFAVDVALKAKVRVEAAAPEAYDNLTGRTGPLPAFDFAGELDLHLKRPARAATALELGDGAVLELDWDATSQALVLWTQPGKPFVCVEPWSDVALPLGGAVNTLRTGERVTYRLGLRLR